MATLIGPKRYNRAKLEAYECGIEPTPTPAAGRRGGRLDTALVGLELGPVVPLRTDQRGHDHGEDRKACPEGSQYEDGRIRVHRSSLLSVGTDCWRLHWAHD